MATGYGSHPSYGNQPAHQGNQPQFGAGGPFGQQPNYGAQQRPGYGMKQSNGIATAAFVIGLINILLFWIPVVGQVLVVVGLVLAVVGYVKSRKPMVGGKWMSIIAGLLVVAQGAGFAGIAYFGFSKVTGSFESAGSVYVAADAVLDYQAKYGELPETLPSGVPALDAFERPLVYAKESDTDFTISSDNLFPGNPEDDLVYDSRLDTIVGANGDAESYNRFNVAQVIKELGNGAVNFRHELDPLDAEQEEPAAPQQEYQINEEPQQGAIGAESRSEEQ